MYSKEIQLFNTHSMVSVSLVGTGSDNKMHVLKISKAITPPSDNITANAIAKAEHESF